MKADALQQAKKLMTAQDNIADITAQLKQKYCEADYEGVTCRVNLELQILSITISDAALQQNKAAALQTLTELLNIAITEAKKQAQAEMVSVMSKMKLPID